MGNVKVPIRGRLNLGNEMRNKKILYKLENECFVSYTVNVFYFSTIVLHGLLYNRLDGLLNIEIISGKAYSIMSSMIKS